MRRRLIANVTREARRHSSDLLLGGLEVAFYMLYAYAKNEQGDLTRSQARVLAALIREEFK